jgi:hypothetical protein
MVNKLTQKTLNEFTKEIDTIIYSWRSPQWKDNAVQI